MKKIILVLMAFCSFAFAETCPIVMNGKVLMGNGQLISSSYFSPSSISTYSTLTQSGVQGTTTLYTKVFGETCTYVDGTGGMYTCGYMSCRYDVVYCPSGQELNSDGECVTTPEPTPVPACDYVNGQYLNPSTNTCTDCSSFPTLAGRASCACDSQGSTYNDQSVTGTYTDTHGFTNYDRTDAKCANGGYIPILLNPRPVDNNSTTPTTPTPTPDNNTSGGGTGTGSGGTGGGSGGSGSGSGGTTTPDANTTGGSTGGGSTSGTNYADLIAQLKTNNQSVNDFKDKFNQFATANQSNADKQLNATNAIKSAVDGTTSAVNTQGTAITGKLGDILSAIKDGNGTGKSGDGNSTNNVDLNATNKKLDTLHDDNNKTQGILDKIKGMFDNNDSFKVPDTNGSTPKVEDLIKDENWFNTNKMKLDFSYSGDCYCQTAQFEVGGRTFIFPPQELLDMIPFDVISKMLMAFVYLIGLRQFLRN